jgi:Tfp pilus assembly protein PilN
MFRISKQTLALVFALLFPAPLLRAQQSSMDDLRKEIQSLSETIKAMQKDLQEIKALLSSRAPATPPQKVLLDLGNNPSRGQVSAKLILIEFSDYQ